MDHTLAEGDTHVLRIRSRWVRLADGWRERMAEAGFERGAALGRRDLGEPVCSHRSSWVRRLTIDNQDVYIKTYDYPTARDRRRGIGRTTALARSRAAREWDALAWLLSHDFVVPQPIAVSEQRRFAVLRRAILVTAAWPGRAADQVLSGLDDANERNELLDAIAAFVSRLHLAGFRDRNLDLRNLLVDRDRRGAWRVVKIDSPKHRIVRPGPHDDALARLDRQRLRASLRAVGIDGIRGLPAP